MKKADILRLMAAIIFAETTGKELPDDYEDGVDYACDSAERIYDRLNVYDPNTKDYIEDSDPAYEKEKKSLKKLVARLKKDNKSEKPAEGKSDDEDDVDDLPF